MLTMSHMKLRINQSCDQTYDYQCTDDDGVTDRGSSVRALTLWKIFGTNPSRLIANRMRVCP